MRRTGASERLGVGDFFSESAAFVEDAMVVLSTIRAKPKSQICDAIISWRQGPPRRGHGVVESNA